MTAPHTISKKLGDRQLATLLLAAQGLSYQQIGERLYVSESTVKSTMGVVTRKLGARNRFHCIHLAHQLRLAAFVNDQDTPPGWDKVVADNAEHRLPDPADK